MTAPAGLHLRQEGLGRPEERQGVDGEGLLYALVRDLEQRPAADDAGVVDEQVDVAGRGPHLCRARVDLLPVADVAGEGPRAGGTKLFRLRRGLPGALGVQVPDRHGRPERGAAEHEQASDARRAPGDEDMLVVDRRHSPLLVT